jgi:hypothetical protein
MTQRERERRHDAFSVKLATIIIDGVQKYKHASKVRVPVKQIHAWQLPKCGVQSPRTGRLNRRIRT